MQDPADTGLVNEIKKTKESRQALRWLARELAWERVLTGLRADDTVKDLSRAA